MKRVCTMLILAGMVTGCSDSVDKNLEKREMDRISYRNSSLLKVVDEQKDRINQLELELQKSRAQIQSLQDQQKASPAPAAASPATSTTQPWR
jgi:hypothetical protein